MGFFSRLFGKQPAAAPSDDLDDDFDDDEFSSAPAQPVQGPPEFVKAVKLQEAYWSFNSAEYAQLESRGVEQLSWPDLFRYHHLNCLRRLGKGPERELSNAPCLQSLQRLLLPESPYRARPALVWQGLAAPQGNEREPDLQGEMLNPSLTHLGCLEVCRVDAKHLPTRLDFVSFDELAGVMFAPPSLLRAAKLFYNDGRDEVVLVPLLYGITWSRGNAYDRAGEMTRFLAHLDSEQPTGLGVSGLGIGQQDLTLHNQQGGASLFGLGSVSEISFPLDMRDLRFDEKARARGIDPEEVRQRMNGG